MKKLWTLLAVGLMMVGIVTTIPADAYAQTSKLSFNQACKAKYPAYASWMETRWTTCTRAPTPRFSPEQLKAWQCWCGRRG
jgi:hypothetical protein